MSEEREPYVTYDVTYVKWAEETGHPLDAIAKEVHNAWMEESARQGRVAPGTTKCPECDWKLRERFECEHTGETKKYLHCDNCGRVYVEHSDMIPYEQLPESVKEYDRATVWAVLNALKNREITNNINRELFTIIAAITEQCGGEIAIKEKHFIQQGTIGLNFERNPATCEMEITLHEKGRP